MSKAIRNGKNVWVNGDGRKIKCIGNPDPREYGPAFPESRVRGSEYTPYQGGSEWEKAANKSMASRAQSNFARR